MRKPLDTLEIAPNKHTLTYSYALSRRKFIATILLGFLDLVSVAINNDNYSIVRLYHVTKKTSSRLYSVFYYGITANATREMFRGLIGKEFFS